MRATFYYDLGSPYAYLAAERISGLFTEAELEHRLTDLDNVMIAGAACRTRPRRRIVHPHPTVSEAVLDAPRAVDGWAIHA